jgi:SAM-dependent methyltransferase
MVMGWSPAREISASVGSQPHFPRRWGQTSVLRPASITAMTDVHPIAARGFSRGADTYARGRPDFPPAALDWLTDDLGLRSGKTALELGAGTGKFTPLLVKTGASVTAVEPAAAMLDLLVRDLPSVRALQGAAQHIPLPDSCADAVVCAQAFHWFASPEVLAEIRRVLQPGGVLGLIWNVRDQRVDWVAKLTHIMAPYEADAPRYDNGEWRHVFPAAGFGPLLERSFTHEHRGSPEQVIVERVASVSFIAALDEARRAGVLEEVRALIASTTELMGRATVAMPYITRAYWCRRD